MQTPQFAAIQRDSSFPGGLLCRSACQGGWPLAAPRFAHSIPESRRRNRAGLNQGSLIYHDRQREARVSTRRGRA